MSKPSSWMFKTSPCNGSIAGKNKKQSWQGWPILRPSVDAAHIISDTARNLHMDPVEVLRVVRGVDDAIRARLKGGQCVNMDLVGFTIRMTGALDSSDAAFDSERNALRVVSYAKPVLRDCLMAEGIVPRNVTHGLKSSVFSVQDNVAHKEGVITVPKTVQVAGINIHMGPNDDEWCGLFTKNGKLAARATVLRNDGGIADLSFGKLPADGEYNLTVFARNGAPVDRAPAVARRLVTVRAADAFSQQEEPAVLPAEIR